MTNGNGTIALYAGMQQFTLSTSTNTVTALRYYTTSGGPTEIRSSTGSLTYEMGNVQGTNAVAITADAAQTETRRFFTPYGGARGSSVNWVDNRGFVDQPVDTLTGLDLLGQRNYDPGTGRFLQRDPVQETGDAIQLAGYTYADLDPIGDEDPTGKMSSENCATLLCYQEIEQGSQAITDMYAASCTTQSCYNAQEASNCHCNDQMSDPLFAQHYKASTTKPKAKPKKQSFWHHITHAASSAGHWVEEHKKAILIGVAVVAAVALIAVGGMAIVAILAEAAAEAGTDVAVGAAVEGGVEAATDVGADVVADGAADAADDAASDATENVIGDQDESAPRAVEANDESEEAAKAAERKGQAIESIKTQLENEFGTHNPTELSTGTRVDEIPHDPGTAPPAGVGGGGMIAAAVVAVIFKKIFGGG
jgi:RHS repeat-associated protein